jgi:dinuclear metal center YbgI/SA1388 family protein
MSVREERCVIISPVEYTALLRWIPMPVELSQLETVLTNLLRPEQFKDYCPNGLQIEGGNSISKIVTGVTASKALLDAAIAASADAILVHHGYFWQGENPCLKGAKKARVKILLDHNISLFAYHLPLDVHQELGNNVQLARRLEIEVTGDLKKQNNHPLVFSGVFAKPITNADFALRIKQVLGREALIVQGRSETIKTIAWCTGAAQNYIETAVDGGVDAYLTGEVSEQTIHIARESGIHFFSAGHHATERYGAFAVGEYLAEKLSIEHEFIDIPNPV